MSNFFLIRDILSGSWQIDYNTFAAYYPLAINAVKGTFLFDKGTEEQSSLPYTISAQNNHTQSSNKSIRVIPIKGVMLRDDTFCGMVGTRTIANRITEAMQAPDTLGIILQVDSGGGQTSAVPELTEVISKRTKPIIAFVDGTACSAAQYTIAYCDEAIASRPTDNVGCIGTMVSMAAPQIGATDSEGNTVIRIYADGSEEKNQEFEEALKGNYKLIKERVLNPNNEQFKADIRSLRPLVDESHLKGRTFQASEVLGVLIDSIGDINHAAARIVELAETPAYKTNQQEFINMEKYPKLLQTIGVTELADDKGHSTLNTGQLTAIETALSQPADQAQQLAEAQTTIAAHEKTIAELTLQIEELNNKAGADSAHITKETNALSETETDTGIGSTYNSVKQLLKG